MKGSWVTAGVLWLSLGCSLGCSQERRHECERFLEVMNPLQGGSVPTAARADQARDALSGLTFQDQPLREYASSAKATLTVLASTLHVSEAPSAPDGTDDLVKQKVAEALTELRDVTRYCSQ